MSPRLFVKQTYKNLSQVEQQQEIEYLEQTQQQNDAMKTATMTSWQQKN